MKIVLRILLCIFSFHYVYGLDTNNIVDDRYAYIVNYYSANMLKCYVTESGIDFDRCTVNQPQGLFKGPLRMVVHDTFAYTVNFNGNNIVQCKIGNEGIDINSCKAVTPTNPGAFFDYPSDMAFYESFAFITNEGPAESFGTYTRCHVNKDSGLEPQTCITSGITVPGVSGGNPILNHPDGVVVSNNNIYFNNWLLYEVSSAAYLTQCKISISGNILPNTCSNFPLGAINGPPRTIKIYDSHAFIPSGNGYEECNLGAESEIDSKTCSYKNIAAYVFASDISFSGHYAYMSDFSAWPSIYRCNYSKGVIDDNCTIYSNSLLTSPHAIAFSK